MKTERGAEKGASCSARLTRGGVVLWASRPESHSSPGRMMMRGDPAISTVSPRSKTFAELTRCSRRQPAGDRTEAHKVSPATRPCHRRAAEAQRTHCPPEPRPGVGDAGYPMCLGVQPDGRPAGAGPSLPQHWVSKGGELTVDASSLPPHGEAPAVTSGAEACGNRPLPSPPWRRCPRRRARPRWATSPGVRGGRQLPSPPSTAHPQPRHTQSPSPPPEVSPGSAQPLLPPRKDKEEAKERLRGRKLRAIPQDDAEPSTEKDKVEHSQLEPALHLKAIPT